MLSLEIEYNEYADVYDYWYIISNGERIEGTNTPNETMARRWLSMEHLKLSKDEINAMVDTAKRNARLSV